MTTNLSYRSRRIVNSSFFQNFMLLVILLASILVGLETYDTGLSNFITILDRTIMLVFLIEIILKIMAEGKKPWNYFKDGWNLIDFFVVVVYFLPINAKFITAARMIRLLRVLRVITFFPQLRLIVSSLLKAIPSMIYVFVLLVLHFYIYACAGTTLFGQNDPFHFGTLHISMLSLFRAVTLEDWADIMYVNMYGCDKISYEGSALCKNPQPQPVLAALFFVSFIFTGAMIILNMLIGVIINGIEEVKEEQNHKDIIKRKESEHVTIHDEMFLIQQRLADISYEFKSLNIRIAEMQRQNNQRHKRKDGTLREKKDTEWLDD
ncbi:MAG: ion transporter [Bacteroidetes bacterium]|nr:MAG: ion transporter [Bacteroidota bacterium]TAG87650.1 MAG: ion transporter [Bacteroidota bacterium]